MHIAVVCPRCQSRYQVDPSLRGKRMRCPNTICRAVFDVQPEEETPSPAVTPAAEVRKETPPAAARTGSVGDLVPILPAEAVEPPPSKPPTTRPAPAEPPPPRAEFRTAREEMPTTEQPPAAAEARTPPVTPSQQAPQQVAEPEFPWDVEEAVPTEAPLAPEKPREVTAGVWTAPPVRRPETTGVPELGPTVSPEVVQETPPAAAPKSVRKRRRLGVMALLVGVLLAGGGAGWWLLQQRQATGEEERYRKALELYDNESFADASTALQQLARDFPASNRRGLYRFLGELSDIRAEVYGPGSGNPAEALDRVLQFLEIYKNDPLLKDRHGDVWRTLVRLAQEAAAAAEQKADAAVLVLARRAWSEAGKFQAPTEGQLAEASRRFKGDFARIEKQLAEKAARLDLLNALRGLRDKASAAAVQQARALVEKAGLNKDAEAAALVVELLKAHRASITFVPAPEPRPAPEEDTLPSLYVAPLVGPAKTLHSDQRIVLVLARGVLYALDPTASTVRWVRRVGIDTAALPLHVPADPVRPEMFLVLSSDSKTLAGVEAETGRTRWTHALHDACVCRPVRVGRHVLVPTLSGRVEEVEITAGRSQGYYVLGQPLLHDPVHQAGTSLVYIAADSYAVYALDVARRECAGILYTKHAPGTLCGRPLVWTEAKPGDMSKGETNGWLLLTEAAGSEQTLLKAYSLPLGDPDRPPAIALRLRGRALTSPWHDTEKLALPTTTGILGVLGVRQAGNRDPLLFPLLPEDYVVASAPAAGWTHAHLAHVERDTYWVWVASQLHRLQMTFSDASGPGMIARWRVPAGTPLHAPQTLGNSDGTTLVLAAQDADGPTSWARALDGATGQTRWTRQLGLTCGGPLLAQGQRVFCPDPRGLFAFDLAQLKPATGWQPGGVLVAPHVPSAQFATLPHKGEVLHLTWEKNVVHLRRLSSSADASDAQASSVPKTWELSAAPHGTAAAGSNFVLVPLANGLVGRLPLDGSSWSSGPDWRAPGADEAQPGHIVALGNDDFLITDGARGLSRVHWGETKLWKKTAAAALEHRILGPPAFLGPDVVVVDASDTATLLHGDTLQVKRRWALGGTISAGPFVRGPTICCVVAQKRLVGLAPNQDEPAWAYDFPAAVVGQPELVEGRLVVANLAGEVLNLDPATGRATGPGYTFRANVVAAAAPVAFGPGRVFVPLTDGTCVLLPLER